MSLPGCIEEVDVRRDKVKYTIDVKQFKVLVNATKYPVYNYGDCLLIEGELKRPYVLYGFDYAGYLKRYGIYGIFDYPDLVKLSDTAGNLILNGINVLRRKFETVMLRIFPDPHASFMAGLVLGSRRGIPDDLMEAFNLTGLTHIIAISGYNITLVIVLAGIFFGFLERRKKIIFAIFFVVGFIFFVGAGASVVRAGIMGVIGLLAVFFGRQYFVGLSLIGSAFFMNLFNPQILLHDVGFQLSFLATSGIVYVSPLIGRYFNFLPSAFALREAAILTVSAQIFVLPVIIYNFGRVSVISPLANIFVLPFIPVAMMLGFFSVIAFSLWPVLGLIVGFLGYLDLEIVIFLVKFFGEFHFASLEIGWFPWWMVLVYYIFLIRLLQKEKVDFI